MRAYFITITVLWLTAFAGPPALRADDGPMFGGTPIVERVDEFGGDGFDFLVTVYTAVYYGPDTELPDALELVELNEGESYLIYLLDNQGETSVDLFGLLNPDSITIPAAGILPADIVKDESFDPDDLVHPSVWFFGIDLISFAWDESFGLLGPGNWSLVFYRSKGWQDVTSWVGDSSDGGLDLDLLLGPSEDVDLPEEPNDCPADVNGDGVVDFLDIGFVIARFGECPVSDCDDSPDDCEDGVDCTDDVCQDGTCVYMPNDAACDDDGLFCNGSEGCDAVEGCVSGGDPCEPGTFCNEATNTCDECQADADCNDGVGCTNDACVDGSCVSTPDDGNCDNGLFCDGAEPCDQVNDCQAGTAPDCDDAVGCTDDSCNQETDSCNRVANDANCDNGLFCDGAETCDGANDCQAGTAPDCDDALGCTDDSCNEETDSCDHLANDANCDNGLFCDGAETCDVVNDCQAGTAPDCDDAVGCTDDSCNEETESCDHVANDANCPDDGLFCNGAEVCDAVEGCVSTGDPCEPGTFCNEDTDTCDECAQDSDCDDSVGCTDDSCQDGTCVFTADDANCEDDGLFCNGVEECHPDDGCISAGDPCNSGTLCNEYAERCIPIPVGVALNEIRVDQVGDDTDEYFELLGPPSMKLDGLTYVVIGDGVAGSGEIEAVIDLSGQEVPSGGFFLVAEATFSLNGITPDLITNLNFENIDNVTHLLVSDFVGVIGDDLDLDDDGILDVEPWSVVLGCIGLLETVGSGEWVYCNTTVGPLAPIRVYRCPDGVGHWEIGLFDDLTFDTPRAPNICPPPVCGDGVCGGDGEDCFSCPDDCRCMGPECASACCGNGICEGDELADNCTIDCGPCTANTDCDNQNPCTSGLCLEGRCFSTPVDCDDADACTADSCGPSSGCVHESIDCGDEDACTNDGCDPDTGCTYDTVDCDDDDACTLDSCDPVTGCVSDPIDCDDGNPCTTDGCDAGNGLCVNEPISSCCGNESCELGEDSCACPIDCGEPPLIETNCADGIDEDCDELIDCDDVDCELDPICICVVDGECVEGEDCVNCPEDCFAGGGTCGDGICEGDGEDCFTCMADCPCSPTPDACWACCGDGVCTPVLESEALCPVDCDPEFEPPSSCCGDGNCEGSEDTVNCAVDCAG